MAGKTSDQDRLDRIIAEARRKQDERALAYREKALKLYPWICGRCGREFNHQNLHELTVHHRDHNHDNNPEDGSNWELLCLYCHDNEHARYLEKHVNTGATTAGIRSPASGHKPFSGLQGLLKSKKT
ncbi:MAG: YajD family HNH nuclease [Gammaproteobacteria bacterium]